MHLSSTSRRLAAALLVLGTTTAVALIALRSPASAGADDAKPAATPAKEFDTKEDAAKALIDAAAANDDAALEALAGGASTDVIQSGRDATVEKDRAAFAAAAKKQLKFEEKDGKVTLVVGDEDWPFPIPLVQANSKWRFDAAEGRQEILARRIGRNELTAIKICREYVAAQVEYASKDRDGDKVREYAQRLLSTPGSQDGLYWEKKEGAEDSPLATELAPFKSFLDAPAGTPAPFSGYIWRILVAQGPRAPGGSHSYLVNGNLIAGFALLGVPATYRVTGITSVMVSSHGTIYQRDFGPTTLDATKTIASFDPDDSWEAVGSEDLAASAR